MSVAAAKIGSRTFSLGLVDDRSPTPLYHQVYLILRGKILKGEFAFDVPMPSEQQTAEIFGVSRITAKRALNDLASDGLVKRERGRGTRVIFRAPVQPLRSSVDGLLENLLQMGLETEVLLKSFGYVRPDRDVAQALQCADDDLVQHAIRVRSLDGEPFSYLETYVPEQIGRSYSRDDLATRPLLELLERSGVVISRAEQTINATLANIEVANALVLDLAAPLLSIQRTVYDQNDKPVEFIRALYRPDRYQYRMMLSRVGDEMSRSWSPTSDQSESKQSTQGE